MTRRGSRVILVDEEGWKTFFSVASALMLAMKLQGFPATASTELVIAVMGPVAALVILYRAAADLARRGRGARNAIFGLGAILFRALVASANQKTREGWIVARVSQRRSETCKLCLCLVSHPYAAARCLQRLYPKDTELVRAHAVPLECRRLGPFKRLSERAPLAITGSIGYVGDRLRKGSANTAVKNTMVFVEGWALVGDDSTPAAIDLDDRRNLDRGDLAVLSLSRGRSTIPEASSALRLANRIRHQAYPPLASIGSRHFSCPRQRHARCQRRRKHLSFWNRRPRMHLERTTTWLRSISMKISRDTVSSAFTTVAIVAAVLLTGCEEPGYRSPGCNVILISIDTLRADHLSLYGYERETSPHLEALATEAIVFDSFMYNGGGTLPSHMTMMTSLHPMTHGLGPNEGRALAAERVTLAESFKRAGYATAAYVDGGWLRGRFGFSQGFDLYDDTGGTTRTGRFKNILPKVYDWLDVHYLEKFFLFIHTYDVHSESIRLPYDCPGDYPSRYTAPYDVDFDGCRQGRCASALLTWINSGVREGRREVTDIFTPKEIEYITALYDGCINYVDDRLSELLDRLRELAIYEDTLVVLISDHGEEFLEHGRLLHDQGGYEEFAHLPLVIKLPDSKAGGTRVPHLAAMADVMPTILDIAGLPKLAEAQGYSLMPSVFDDTPVRKDVHMYTVLRTGKWKYFSAQQLLYDLDQDPAECTNVFHLRPEKAAELEGRVQRLGYQDRQLSESFPRGVEFTPEEIRNLKALGYLDND